MFSGISAKIRQGLEIEVVKSDEYSKKMAHSQNKASFPADLVYLRGIKDEVASQ
jgi:hypothetical protein